MSRYSERHPCRCPYCGRYFKNVTTRYAHYGYGVCPDPAASPDWYAVQVLDKVVWRRGPRPRLQPGHDDVDPQAAPPWIEADSR